MVMGSDRPIFVVGCPRSGTALLRLMLRAHSRIAIPPETRFLLSAYEHRDAYGDLRELGNRKALAEWIVAGADTRFSILGLDPNDIAEKIVGGPPTLGSALDIVLRGYARHMGKPRWGDQRPGYVQHIDMLLRLFPSAQIVHMIRDGRDCVAALKRTPRWRMGTYHAVATWTQAIDAGRAAARRLPPGSYTETQYEHLVADPESELRRLCAFFGEKYQPAMARPGELASVGIWPRQLEKWEISLCEMVMTERLIAHGYLPSAAARPAAYRLARYASITTHRRLAARKRAVLDRRISAREPWPVASLLRTLADKALT